MRRRGRARSRLGELSACWFIVCPPVARLWSLRSAGPWDDIAVRRRRLTCSAEIRLRLDDVPQQIPSFGDVFGREMFFGKFAIASRQVAREGPRKSRT